MVRTYTISDMQQLAQKHGGKCISEKYISLHSKLLWECADGHQWETIPAVIIRGMWCPICARIKKKIALKNKIVECQQLAELRGGFLLSEEYLGAKIKLSWKCKKGHIFQVTPDNVKQGRWCPECKDKRPVAMPNKVSRKLVEIIPGSLWRFGRKFIATESYFQKIDTITTAEWKKLGLDWRTLKLVKQKHPSLIISIPHKEFWNEIPVLHIYSEKRMYAVDKKSWQEFDQFIKKYPITVSPTMLEIIIEHYLDIKNYIMDKRIDVKTINHWIQTKGPKVYNKIDYGKIYDRCMQCHDNETQQLCATLGILFSIGCLYYSEKVYVWAAPTEISAIVSNECLIPTNTAWYMKDYCDKSRKIITSITSEFIKFLESKNILRWKGNLGKIYISLEDLEKWDPENQITFVANMIVQHLYINKDNHCFVGIISQNRDLEQILCYIKVLNLVHINPSNIYISSGLERDQLKFITDYFDKNHILYQNYGVMSDKGFRILAGFGSLGIETYPTFDIKENAESLQRLFEDVIPHAYVGLEKVEEILKYLAFLETDYGMPSMYFKAKKQIAEFRDAIEDMGGFSTGTYEIMKKNVKVFNGVKYCLPIWRIKMS